MNAKAKAKSTDRSSLHVSERDSLVIISNKRDKSDDESFHLSDNEKAVVKHRESVIESSDWAAVFSCSMRCCSNEDELVTSKHPPKKQES